MAVVTNDSGSTAVPLTVDKWRYADLRWRLVWANQTWGLLLLVVAGGTATVLAHYGDRPWDRTVYLYDAQISAIMVDKETVSYAAGGAIPWMAFLITLVIVEWGLLFRKHSITHAVHATIHTFLWCMATFVIVLAATELTKPYASRLRPDFLARCQPQKLQMKGPIDALEIADCTSTDEAALKDGRVSFPSGHSSNSMSVCWFTVIYLAFSMYWRAGATMMADMHKRPGIGYRILMELANFMLYMWLLAVLACAWFIGVSRYHDNRHHPGDVVGGFILAALVVTPCFISWAGQLQWYSHRLAVKQQEDQQQHDLLPHHTHDAGKAGKVVPIDEVPVEAPGSGAV